MKHIILLGDSVFDNGAYVDAGEPYVIHQVRDRIDEEDQATILALDGATTQGVPAQIQKLPEDATHLVVSAGGNNLLNILRVFEDPVDSMVAGINRIHELQTSFRNEYRDMMNAVMKPDLPVLLSTIYSGNFEEEEMKTIANTVLPVFNRVIMEEAITNGLPVLDLDLICHREEHYANPIEPSAAGGEQIANAIVMAINEHPFDQNRTTVYG